MTAARPFAARAIRLAVLAVLVGFVPLGAGSAGAGTAKEYAYLSVQGKLTQAGDGRALSGATVVLRGDAERHRAATDSRGVFSFAKLPLGSYAVDVRTADGETIRNVRRFETRGPALTMVQIRVGRGGPGGVGTITIDADRDSVEVEVPEPRVRWERLWRQGVVFVAAVAAVSAGL